MATNLALRNTQNASSALSADERTTIHSGGLLYDMVTTFGSAADTVTCTTTASGTEIIFNEAGAEVVWVSGRAPSGGFTLTSTFLSAWLHESNMNANAGGRFRVFQFTPDGGAGTLTELGGGPFNDGVELGTAAAEMTWTGNVTDTAFAENDRIVVKLYATNVGTMGGGFTVTHTFNAASAATGDSFFQTAETVTFKAELLTQDTAGTETATITETGVGLAVAAAVDALTISESAIAEAVLALLASENISVSEDAESEQVFAFAGADSFTISESGSFEEVQGFTATETLTLTEDAEQAEGPSGPPLYVYGDVRVLQYIERGSITISEWILENARTDLGPLVGSTGVSVTVYAGHTTDAPSTTYAMEPTSASLGNYRVRVREPGTPEIRGFAVFTISTPSTGTWRMECPVH